jgi:biopolymer transport protein ExbD
MAIKRGSKVDQSFSSASMTDLMFLLLVFLLMATTLINPNAIKVVLPKSSNQLKDKAITTVTIQKDGNSVNYYVETQQVGSLDELERALRARLEGQHEPTVSIHCDKRVIVDEFVKVSEIGRANGYRMLLATQP